MMHLVIAPIILPALMAALCLILPKMARGLTAITLMGLLAMAIFAISLPQPMPYFLGTWPAPFGIVLVLDRLSSVMLLLVAGLSAVVAIYALASGWDHKGRHFYPLFLLQIMGLNGAFLTADAFNLFVFFEVLLIASYGLMAHGGMRAGVHYVAFNLLGSAVFLLALGLIYNLTGTLNMADIGQKLPLLPAQDAGLVRVAAVLFLAVFMIKGALMPLQFWLPRTYSATSAPVAALFAVMTKLGAYAVIRFGTLVFPATLPSLGTLWADVIYGAALATILFGGLGVFAARTQPLLISSAAVGSMGVVFLSISAFTPASLAAAVFYALHSTLATALLFLLAEGRSRGLFLAGAVAMVGLPPLSGFLGKVMILQALPDPLAWAVVLFGSLLTMIGFAKMGSDLYWKSESAQPEAPIWPMGILLAAIIGLTVCAAPVMGYLSDARMFDLPAYIAVQNLGGM